MELKCEHQGNRATFLELEITIVNGIFVYKLFDKRDEFPFEIVRMPNLEGNIPHHIFYGSFTAEILRIGRATLLYEDFLPRIKQIFKRMKCQGGNTHKLTKSITQVMHKYSDIFLKYNKTSQEVVSQLH